MGGSRSHLDFFVENHPKIVLNQAVLILWSSIQCVFCLYIHYDFSVLSMSVIGFQKQSLDGGWVGGVNSIQLYLEFFQLCKAP